MVEGAVACLQQDGPFALAVDGCVGNFLVLRGPTTHTSLWSTSLRGGCPARPTSSRF